LPLLLQTAKPLKIVEYVMVNITFPCKMEE